MIELIYVPNPMAQALTVLLEASQLPWTPYRPEHIDPIPDPKRFPPLLIDDQPVGVDHPIELFHPGASMIYLAAKARSVNYEVARRFCPEDPRESFAAEQWVIWQAACHTFRSNDIHREHLANLQETLFDRLESWLSDRRQFVAGTSYSIADMICYPWIKNWLGQDGELDPRYEYLRRWLGEVGERQEVRSGIDRGRDTPQNGRSLPDRLARATEIMHDLRRLGNGTSDYPPGY